ncbi:hypothetical protein ABKN59_010296 [Abortiporus biennis]
MIFQDSVIVCALTQIIIIITLSAKGTQFQGVRTHCSGFLSHTAIHSPSRDDIKRTLSHSIEMCAKEDHVCIPRYTILNTTIPSPTLPWEIIEIIIDEIANPPNWPRDGPFNILFCREFLLNCCMSCRRLLSFARPILYRNVQFNPESVRFKMRSFLETLKNSPHLRELTVSITIPGGSNSNSVTEPFTHFFLRGPVLLPRLKTVTLAHIPALNPSLMAARGAFKHVLQLSIDDTQFHSLLDIRRIVESFFPNVTSLSLRECSVKSGYTSICRSNPRLTSISLSDLHFHSGSSPLPHVLYKWVSSTKTCTHSTLQCLTGPDVFIWLLLPSIGPHLLELHLNNLDYHHFIEAAWLSFGVDTLPILQILRVRLNSRAYSVPWFCKAILRSEPSPTLRCIKLDISANLKDRDFGMIDDTLVNPFLSNVVCIEVHPEFVSSFPKLEKKGVIKGNVDFSLVL